MLAGSDRLREKVGIQSVPWPKIRPAGNSSSVAASPIGRRWPRDWRTWNWCWVRPPGGSRGRRTIPARTLSRLGIRSHRVPTPPPLRRQVEIIRNYHPSSPLGQPNHIKFRPCSALAPMLSPPINESAELTQRDLLLIHYSELEPGQ
jgi:hypothetical protein